MIFWGGNRTTGERETGQQPTKGIDFMAAAKTKIRLKKQKLIFNVHPSGWNLPSPYKEALENGGAEGWKREAKHLLRAAIDYDPAAFRPFDHLVVIDEEGATTAFDAGDKSHPKVTEALDRLREIMGIFIYQASYNREFKSIQDTYKEVLDEEKFFAEYGEGEKNDFDENEDDEPMFMYPRNIQAIVTELENTL